MAPLLTTIDLTIGYQQEREDYILFKNLDLEILPGQLICFMGPNGIGKSTLIRTLAGLQKPLAGKVFFENPDDAISKKLSVVLTDKINTGNLTVKELISYGRYPYLHWNLKLTREDAAVIDSSIRQLQLNDLVDRRIYELSDGQLQMTMIARALAQDTNLILLDEPTAHLDLNNRVEIMNLLRKIAHDTKRGILMATHELDLALQTADLIWLTGKEKNILNGVPEDLVLNNTFDTIFQFKGFDLKTGKVHHNLSKKIKIKLKPGDHKHRWTKNALERNGYGVDDDTGDVEIMLSDMSTKTAWTITSATTTITVSSIEVLLSNLQTIEHGRINNS